MPIRTSISEMKADLQIWGKGLRAIVKSQLTEDITDFFQRVVELTPKESERAAGSWLLSIGYVRNSDLGRGDHGGASAAAIALARSLMESYDSSDFRKKIYINNTVPYIRMLEFGGYNEGPKVVGGFSRKAPYGMVRQAALDAWRQKGRVYTVVRNS